MDNITGGFSKVFFEKSSSNNYRPAFPTDVFPGFPPDNPTEILPVIILEIALAIRSGIPRQFFLMRYLQVIPSYIR